MSNNRIIELDIFRGIAAISVVLFHYTTRYNNTFETDTMNWFEFSFGHYGVQLFFIISGFVIFMTLERSANSLDFIKRRFIRLYPTFWIGMTITFVLTSVAGVLRFERTLTDLLVNTTMIPSILGCKPIDGVYWSLEVEIMFYFIMSILLYFKLLKFIFSIMLAWLFIGGLSHYFDASFFNLFLITNYSYLFISGISFYKIFIHKNLQDTKKYHVLIILSLIYGFTKNIEEGFFVLLCFSLFYLFISNRLKFLTDLKLFKPFTFLGDISYSLYLIHQFIGMIIIFKLSKYIDNYFILLLIPMIVSILMAWIITRFLDKPIQNKLKTLFSD